MMNKLYDIALQITDKIRPILKWNEEFNAFAEKVFLFTEISGGCVFFWREVSKQETENLVCLLEPYEQAQFIIKIIGGASPDDYEEVECWGLLENDVIITRFEIGKSNDDL